MDPLGSLSLILGPEMLRKILIVGCCLLFVGMFAALSVFIVNDFIGAYVQIAVQKQAKAFGLGGRRADAGADAHRTPAFGEPIVEHC